jgi:hypothetical protein
MSKLLLFIFVLVNIVSYDILESQEFSSSTNKKKKLLVVHSYSYDFEFTKRVDDGIVEALRKYNTNDEWTIERIFLHGKKVTDPKKSNTIIAKAKKKILTHLPDAAILTDDLAFKSFFRLLKNYKVPLSFSGINGDIESYGYKFGESGIAGTLESYNMAAVVRIVLKLRPSIKNILIIL